MINLLFKINRYHRRNIDELFSGWFCFVQAGSGKILAVHHSAEESDEAVDFKKSVAAAFQANFEGTRQEQEDDPQSEHIAHYRYMYNHSCSIIIISVDVYIGLCIGTVTVLVECF